MNIWKKRKEKKIHDWKEIERKGNNAEKYKTK